jgi:hypothetical protein
MAVMTWPSHLPGLVLQAHHPRLAHAGVSPLPDRERVSERAGGGAGGGPAADGPHIGAKAGGELVVAVLELGGLLADLGRARGLELRSAAGDGRAFSTATKGVVGWN